MSDPIVDITKKDRDMIAHAASNANKSNLHFKHGAVITCGNKPISDGVNNHRNCFGGFDNSKFGFKICSCHAEMDAIYRSGLINSTYINKSKMVSSSTIATTDILELSLKHTKKKQCFLRKERQQRKQQNT